MLCSRLYSLKEILNHNQYTSVIGYLSQLSPGSKLTASKLMHNTGLDIKTVQSVLDMLLDSEILTCTFAVQCPECGLLVKSFNKIYEIERYYTCYHCDANFEIEDEDVDLVYSFNQYPFDKGQQRITQAEELFAYESVAPSIDSLARYLSQNNKNFNKLFFSPSDEDYQKLEKMYDSIFHEHITTKEKGDTLEELTRTLFSLCHHFTTSSIRMQPNQIDCYVRNVLFIPGFSKSDCVDSFIIECKNEKTTPKSGYINKLHSILRLSRNNFGIIVSQCKAPRTFLTLANSIFLSDSIIVISCDKDDLDRIINQKSNLLECIERKITEVKTNSTSDLIKNGLYQS